MSAIGTFLPSRNVRFTPNIDREADIPGWKKSANSRHSVSKRSRSLETLCLLLALFFHPGMSASRSILGVKRKSRGHRQMVENDSDQPKYFPLWKSDRSYAASLRVISAKAARP